MLKFFNILGPDDRTLYEAIQRIWIRKRNILWLYKILSVFLWRRLEAQFAAATASNFERVAWY